MGVPLNYTPEAPVAWSEGRLYPRQAENLGLSNDIELCAAGSLPLPITPVIVQLHSAEVYSIVCDRQISDEEREIPLLRVSFD